MKLTLCLLALGCAAGLISGAPSSSWFDEVVLRAGRTPGPLAVADLNHDGKPDIVVGNEESENAQQYQNGPNNIHQLNCNE
jgi:hypothetical protein